MIHKTSKKSEWLVRKDPQLPMKSDNSRAYMKEHNKAIPWYSWSIREGHRLVLRTAAPTQIV